jgi:tRNA U34 5-carboxymethylaminomethyl modifying GTPase MnmE/TrmE
MLPAETIFALSSGRPPAAIAVIRVSGPQAGAALEGLIGRVPKPRQAAFATLRDPATKEPLDQAVVLWFPGPASETGEDVAEFQLHGGRAVIAATLATLGRLPGLRLAEAGEFTRRALANGRLDLTAVEGLADLIGAETEAQRRQAVRQAAGVLGKHADAWRTRLIEALALVEAGLDFPDEGDVPADLVAPALRIARELRDEIAAALTQSARGERLREGLTIAVAGPPNAGKSTLFNWLAGREVAIVSPHPGTTRDVLEVHLDLGGYPVTVIDTAGVRDSADPVEQEGIRRARARAAAADLVLWVTDVREAADVHQAAAGAGEAEPGRNLTAGAARSNANDNRAGPGDGLAAHADDALASGAHASGTQVGNVRSGRAPGGEGTDAPVAAPADDGGHPPAGGASRQAIRGGRDADIVGERTDSAAREGRYGGGEIWRVLNKCDLAPARITPTGAVPLGAMPPEGIQTAAPMRMRDPADAAGAVATPNGEQLEEAQPPGARRRGAQSKGAGPKRAGPKRVGESVPSPPRDLEHPAEAAYLVSALTGAGLTNLLTGLTGFAERTLRGAETALVSRARQRQELEIVIQSLDKTMNINSYNDDLVAEHLRLAARALGRLAGRVDVEDVLDVIFRDFCIGK